MSKEIITNNKELKKLLVQRSKELLLPLQFVVEEHGLSWTKFLNTYINVDEAGEYVQQHDLIEIAKVLGITVRVQLIIKSKVEVEELRKMLVEKYYKEKKKRGPKSKID